ncbi:MAG: hypothetical protein WCL44_00510 [bacterium]
MAFVNLDKLLPRERMMLALCCLAVLLAFGNWAVVRRLHTRLADLSAVIRDDSKRLEQNYSIIAKTDEVQAKFDSIKAHIPAVPAIKPTDALSTEIEQMAARCGVSLLDRKPQESVRTGCFEQSSVRFEVVGDQEGLMKLLCRIEASPQLLRIGRLDLTRNPKAGSFPLKAILNVTAIAEAP